MYRILWFLIVSTLLLAPISGAEVDLSIDFSESKAFYYYNFTFNEEDSFSSFSFEKPEGGNIVSAINSLGETINVGRAGDYFIISPNTVRNTSFYVVLETELHYQDISERNIFSSYFSFNFDVSELRVDFTKPENFTEITQITPRTSSEQGNILKWQFKDISESFILLEFEGSADQNGTEDRDTSYYVVLSFLILIIILGFLVLYYFLFFQKDKKQESKKQDSEKINEKTDERLDLNVTLEEEIVQKEDVEEQQKEKLEQFLEKYLTDNERDVVNVILENEGIAQNEILHHLPSLTKSNLSKIITKLHGKRVLNKIRVGKINKIHLGEKLSNSSVDLKDNN